MKFFEKNFNKHHLIHKPHKWFLALLISPIHAAEMHYKEKYHLRFVHARKLFLFDMLLVASIFMLTAVTIFWFTYDPTITKDVLLSIEVYAHDGEKITEQIRSGDDITYTIKYTNKSETKITSPNLSFQLPTTFILKQGQPEENFDAQSKTFLLPDLLPGASGEATISGLFLGNVGEEYHILSILSYKQENKKATEQKLAKIIIIPHRSTLETKIEAPSVILSHSTLPISVIMKNQGNYPLSNITLPLPFGGEFSVTAIPEVENNQWQISQLNPGEEIKLEAKLTTAINSTEKQKELTLTPILNIEKTQLKQSPGLHEFEIVSPEIKLISFWKDNITTAKPGEIKNLEINIENIGTAELENLSIEIPIPNDIIDANKLTGLNQGEYSQGKFIINQNYLANLKKLEAKGTTNITIKLPIKSQISAGTNIRLYLTPRLTAQVPGILDAIYYTDTETTEIGIGTSLILNAESRYYTAEGDQLGRGSLPPQVGKETKYWTIINIQNTTGRVTDLNFSAQLPGHIQWTGKSSVSQGRDLIYNSGNKTVSWSLPSMSPHETIGLYMELSFTPTASHVGQTPILLQNINLNVWDSYLGEKITKSTASIDISLPADGIGRTKGVIVVD